VPERALLTAKSQSRNDLGEIPTGSLNLSHTTCGSQAKSAQQTRRSEHVGLNPPLGNPEMTATGRAIVEFEALLTTQIPASLLESSFTAADRYYLNIGWGTNCGAISISPLKTSAGL